MNIYNLIRIFILMIATSVLLISSALFVAGTKAEQSRVVPLPAVEQRVVLISRAVEPVTQVDDESKTSCRFYDSIPFDLELQELVWAACEESGCPYELALSVIHKETLFQNIIGDGGNSIGYMQIQPRWNYDRMERLGVTDLEDPLSNFRVGCDLLSELLSKYTPEEALTSYNTGSPGKSRYAASVLEYMEELQKEGGGQYGSQNLCAG